MFLHTELTSSKLLVGKSLRMSLAQDRTRELWQSFMPELKTIKQVPGTYLYSLQVYDGLLNFGSFEPTTSFTKYALAEIATFEDSPDTLEVFTLPGGMYAVFLHRGLLQTFPLTLRYIFGEWLPSSNYELDDRPHFEILGEKYKNNDPTSEEEVWIPIREKLS